MELGFAVGGGQSNRWGQQKRGRDGTRGSWHALHIQ